MHGLSHEVPPKLPTAPMLNHVQVAAPHNRQPGGPARGYPNHGGPRAGLDGTHGNSLTYRRAGRKGSGTTKHTRTKPETHHPRGSVPLDPLERRPRRVCFPALYG